MKNLSKKQLNKYYRTIKKRLPCKMSDTKKLLSSLKQNVQLYLMSNPEATINDIYAHFGTAEEIASSYLNEDNKGYISKRIFLKRIFIVILVATIVCIACYIGLLLDLRADLPNKAIIEIEIE